MARLLVFDGQGVYRTGLRIVISANIPCAKIIEASSLIEALREIRKGVFDLVLVGIDRFNSESLDCLKSARQAAPTTRFALMSASDTRNDILASLSAGFHGFISKQQSDSEILAAINDILSGRIYVPTSLAEEADAGAPNRRFGGEVLPEALIEGDVLKLTKRQREILSLITRGRSNKEIARVLGIAEATTKIHMAALLRALGARNRTEAAIKARNFALENLSATPFIADDDGQIASVPEFTGVSEQALPYVERRIARSLVSAPQATPHSTAQSASSHRPRK
jgi:DNA-binding NarL/FixJ family response regulator